MDVNQSKPEMRWVSALSELTGSKEAIGQVVAKLEKELGEMQPDLICVFVSSHHSASYPQVSNELNAAFPSALLFGCSAGAVLARGEEVEERPGISVMAAVLPGVELTPFHLLAEQFPDDEADLGEWQGILGCRAADNPHFLLLPEPYSVHPAQFLKGLDRFFPEGTKVGGLPSGAEFAGNNILFLGSEMYKEGLIGVAMTGNIQVETVVSQGCRPVGPPMFVTQCKGNILLELDGKSPVAALNELYDTLDADDRTLFQTGLLVGVVMREMEQKYGRGDFLIRNIMGLDPEREAIALGTSLHENQVIQFHVRDADTSAEDLGELLRQHQMDNQGGTPFVGALMFSCLGRGQGLYGESNHDSELFLKIMGEINLAGFFCSGEIGPVHGSTFLHGYTSAFGLFREKDVH